MLFRYLRRRQPDGSCLGWVLVFAGLVVANESRQTLPKAGGIACFVVLPAALTVYFIAIYVRGGTEAHEWALDNPIPMFI